MIVGDYISIGTDNHSRTAPLLLFGDVEEIAEHRGKFTVLLGRLDRHLDEDHGVHGILGRICEIGIVGFCQIDSTVFLPINGISCRRGCCGRLRSGGFHYDSCHQGAANYRNDCC